MLHSPDMLRPGKAGTSSTASSGPKASEPTVGVAETNSGLLERVAALEERTRDKPKGVLDRIKEWSGVATAVLALLYTFPLGVWDRVVVTSGQKRDSRLAEVRSAIVQLSELEASTARSYGSISDPLVRAFYSRAMGSQRAAMLFRIEPTINGIEDRLSVPELILLAYNLAQSGKAARAEQFYSQALRIAERDDTPVALRADVHRMRAQLQATLPGGPDMARLRADYRTNLRLLIGARSPVLLVQALNSGFEWSLFELAQGDWACGERLGTWTRQIFTTLPIAGPDAATLAQAYDAQRRLVTPRSGQEGQGCDAETEAVLAGKN